jgi:hypothetical protein
MIMIAVKGMEMPENCMDCPLFDGEYGTCNIIGKTKADATEERAENCPLVEIVTCKDCRHCFIDEDGHGYHCEKSDTERIPTCADFYCAHAERRE